MCRRHAIGERPPHGANRVCALRQGGAPVGDKRGDTSGRRSLAIPTGKGMRRSDERVNSRQRRERESTDKQSKVSFVFFEKNVDALDRHKNKATGRRLLPRAYASVFPVAALSRQLPCGSCSTCPPPRKKVRCRLCRATRVKHCKLPKLLSLSLLNIVSETVVRDEGSRRHLVESVSAPPQCECCKGKASEIFKFGIRLAPEGGKG